MSIIRRLSVVEEFGMINLKNVSPSVRIVIFNVLFNMCFMSCRMTIVPSHASAKENVSAPSTYRSVVCDLVLDKYISQTMLYLSARKIINPTFDETSLFPLNQPYAFTSFSRDVLFILMNLRPMYGYCFNCFIRLLFIFNSSFLNESFVNHERMLNPS